MSRLERATNILEAADNWKQKCLLDEGSVLSSFSLWTSSNFKQLEDKNVNLTALGSGTEEESSLDQDDSTSRNVFCLWSEVVWLYYLIVDSVSQKLKLDRIRTIWEKSGTEFPNDHWAVGDVLDRGILNPGPGYTANQRHELTYMVALFSSWTSLPRTKREELLEDAWAFASWVGNRTDSNRRQFRHALLYLLFPDEFEPIMSLRHKTSIVESFNKDDKGDLDTASLAPIDIDKELLALTFRLREEYPDQEINYYSPPFVEVWKPEQPKPRQEVLPEEGSLEKWYNDLFGNADVWVIGAGEGGRLWEEFVEKNIVAIGFEKEGDLSEYSDHRSIHEALIRNGRGANPANNSLCAWEFVHEIKIGDILVAKLGRKIILGWGKVIGDYQYDGDRPEYRNVREVEWHPCSKPIHLERNIITKTLTRFTSFKGWLKKTFDLMDNGNGNGGVIPPDDGIDLYDISELFVEEQQFRRILASLALRKNLILQGPPGVGKTFMARRLAWCLQGHKDSSRIHLVQFHQSYSYEDFVQGYRPTEEGGFKLRNGVFYQFCKRAEQEPTKRFVFIIDEINRGNLSRIFGELLMLIESDKRGKEYEVVLANSQDEERFSVPENIYVLGLMNTADRSLAMVDYALRRRFAFETLNPAFESRKFREYLLEADVERDLIDLIVERFSDLNSCIRDDNDLGPGFQIGHSFFVPEESADEEWYATVIETQIAPLLHEYWFDRPDHVNGLIDQLRR